MKYDIFISYRREGGDKYARTIQQALEKQYRVFLDFDELKDGVFDQRIIDAISESPVFLLILSRGALDRCVNEDDWVRQEILHASKCGCHIVPVTIVDDDFDGLPASLPKELLRAVCQHQFSELQMKTLFKASMEQLVNDRIAPYVYREDTASGIEIHIETDVNCDLFRFKTFVRHLKSGEDNVIHLNAGKYKLEFVSSEVPEVKRSLIYTLSPDISCDFIEVAMKDELDEALVRLRAEKDDVCMKAVQKLKAEEETLHKTEERVNRKGDCKQKGVEKKELKLIKRKGKYGFADESDRVIIPCQWAYARNFSEDFALVMDENCLFGFIDKSGEVVIPCQWADADDFSEGLAKVQDENDLYGFVDMSGDLVCPCQFVEIDDFSEGMARVQDEDYQYGFVDESGELVIPCIWDEADPFINGTALVTDEDGNQYEIDEFGDVVGEEDDD